MTSGPGSAFTTCAVLIAAQNRGIEVIDTDNPHTHSDAMGQVGESPHAQALTRERVACTIPVEPEALYSIAYEFAVVEHVRGDDPDTPHACKGMRFLAEVAKHVQRMAVEELRVLHAGAPDEAAGD